MRVLIVDNYDSFTYNLRQLLEQTGLCEVEIEKVDRLNIADVEQYDKIVISPGPGLPSERPILKELILQYHTRKDILGVCLGCQAIAEAFGGSLYNLGYPLHGVAKKVNHSENNFIFENIESQFTVGLYHSWAVNQADLPDTLEVAASSEDGVIMALKHKASNLSGIQFHPESIMTPDGSAIATNWLRK